MATLYEYTCESCIQNNITIEEGEEKAGHLSIFRKMNDRDLPLKCPQCNSNMIRECLPEKFTVWWGNKYNSKKTCLGPTIDYYPPTRERKRKESKRHILMDPYSEKSKILKDDAAKAPKASEAPSPGVSVSKVD